MFYRKIIIAGPMSVGEGVFLEFVFSVLLVFAALMFIVFGVRVRRMAKQCRFDPRRNLMKDSRAPVLYLRSFSDDYAENLSLFSGQTGEESE
jgi:hypothetical protein